LTSSKTSTLIHFIIFLLRGKGVGLGNGQRKSKEFEDFVLEQRKHLRQELKLCEQATQRVLCYSNNFLHKKLKTDPMVSFPTQLNV
jgi:hypothetical protein